MLSDYAFWLRDLRRIKSGFDNARAHRGGNFACLLAFALGGCVSSNNTTASVPQVLHLAIDANKSITANLDPAKLRLIQTVLRNSATEDRSKLIFTLYKNILVLYYGDPKHLNGITPPGAGNCSKFSKGPCRQCYHIIGAVNMSYCPQPVESLPTGSREVAYVTEYKLTAIDRIARAAYASQHVRAPWAGDTDARFWDPTE